ncbi:MAG: hypothetical protein ACR2HK_04810 [Gemmatimonadales bacterium]
MGVVPAAVTRHSNGHPRSSSINFDADLLLEVVRLSTPSHTRRAPTVSARRQPGRVGRPAHRVSSRIGSHPHGSDDGPIRCDGRLLQRDEVRAATARKLELRRLMRQSASNVLATPRSGTPKPAPEVTPPAGGEVRPAA